MHINTYYQNELDSVNHKIIEMANLVNTQLVMAHKSLINKDQDIADDIHKKDKKINEMRDLIEKNIIQIIGTRQPMANDLRFLVSSLRIIDEIERIGDYADNMTNHVNILKDVAYDFSDILNEIDQMLKKVIYMFEDVVQSFSQKNSSLSKSVIAKDDDIDNIHSKVLSLCIAQMMQKKGIADKVTELIYISKTCERIGDRVINISNKVYYFIEGKRFKKIDK